MGLTFQKESFTAIMPELPEIFCRHWEEIALDKTAIKLDPDWERYMAFDASGVLHMLTVREDKKLVGYYLALVMPHLHYKSSLTAFSDIFYILPEHRRSGRGLKNAGYKMFEEVEKMLREAGVQKSYVMTKVHLPITMLMKRLKYRFIERTYTKLL